MRGVEGIAASYARQALETLNAVTASSDDRLDRAADHLAIAADLLGLKDGPASVPAGRAELDFAIGELRAIDASTTSPAVVDARKTALRLIERADRAAGR